MSIFDNIDHVIAALDDKILRTDQGSFIKVDDLKEFHQQVREASVVERAKPKPKSFAEARGMAKRDPMFAQPIQPPRAPALSSVKGVNVPEEADNA